MRRFVCRNSRNDRNNSGALLCSPWFVAISYGDRTWCCRPCTCSVFVSTQRFRSFWWCFDDVGCRQASLWENCEIDRRTGKLGWCSMCVLIDRKRLIFFPRWLSDDVSTHSLIAKAGRLSHSLLLWIMLYCVVTVIWVSGQATIISFDISSVV